MWHLRAYLLLAYFCNSVVNKCCSLLIFDGCVQCCGGQDVDYSRSAVDIYVQCYRHICSGAYANNMNICISLFLVTLVIALGSYEVYILT